MIKTLLKKQIYEMFAFFYQSGKSGKRRSKLVLAGYVLLMTYLAAVMLLMFFQAANALCSPMTEAGLTWLYFALMGIIATALGVVGSIFFVHSGLYQAKDNELLLSMPIIPSQILFVRMAGLYGIVWGTEALVMIPAFIVYWMEGNRRISCVIAETLILFIFPLLALAISCILGWLIGMLSAHIGVRGKSFLSTALALIFLVGFYSFFMKAYSYLQLILVKKEALGGIMKYALYPLYQMGLGAAGSIPAFLRFVLIVLACFGTIYLLIGKSFVKILTSRQGNAKLQYKEKKLTVSTKSVTLLKKEFRRFTGSSTYMLNCGLGTVMLLFVTGFVLFKGAWLRELVMQIFGKESGMGMAFCCLMLCIMVTMNMTTAPSVSMEGKNLWIVQSMPVLAWDVLKAKLMLHLLITVIPAVPAAVCLMTVLESGLVAGVLVTGVILLFILLTASMGLALNLKFPNLDWANETVAVKQGIGMGLAMFGSWAVLMILSGIYYAAGRYFSTELYLICVIIIFAVADAWLVRWLKGRGAEILETL
ncbi:MAG: hypothetical protein IJ390_06530 [Lachnospiraceae bacterium]|nr:hypothetical protein [Lachnospiraceae bacterium]